MKPQTGTQNWLKPPKRQTIIDPQITVLETIDEHSKQGEIYAKAVIFLVKCHHRANHFVWCLLESFHRITHISESEKKYFQTLFRGGASWKGLLEPNVNAGSFSLDQVAPASLLTRKLLDKR